MSGTEVPIKTLLITVFESVIEVFLLCVAGYILSRAGVTDKATQRKLNVINVSLFTPALLFSKVAFSLTPAKLKEMWIIPLGFVLITGLSALVAWVLARIFKLKRSQTAFAICAAMFQNSNSLPIALIQSLVVEVPGLKWGHDDNKDQMLGRALTYFVLYSTLGMMLRWSWGVKLLSQADDEIEEVEDLPAPAPGTTDVPTFANGQAVQSPEAIPHPGARETDPFFSTQDRLAQDEADQRKNPNGTVDRIRVEESPERVSRSPPPSAQWSAGVVSAHSMHHPGQVHRRGSNRSGSVPPPMQRKMSRTDSGREFWGLPEQPKRQRIALPEEPEDSSGEEDNEEDDEWGNLTPGSLRLRRDQPTPPSTKIRSYWRRFKAKSKTFLKAVNSFMTVPMYAALLSIFIALIPPLQREIGKIKPFEQAVRSAGQCSIPVTLVVLGAFFYTPPEAKPKPSEQVHQPFTSPDSANSRGGYFERKFRALADRSSSGGYPGENKTVFVAVISRMIIVPLLMMPLLALMAKYDIFEAAADPVFVLSAVLLVSSPPALTLAQITQAASGDAFERLISKTISWSYAVLTPPLTVVYVVIGLVFGKL